MEKHKFRKWPKHIATSAFIIHPSEESDEFIAAFATRWDGLDLSSLVKALAEGDETDRVFAITALGQLKAGETHDLLRPFLLSANTLERWASALELADSQDDEAFDVLCAMLAEVLPNGQEFGTCWYYWSWRRAIPAFLALYQRPVAVPFLRQALIEAISLDPLLPEDFNAGIPTWLRSDNREYLNAIVFALGRLGAPAALIGIQHDEKMLGLWRAHLAVGMLHGKYALVGRELWRDNSDLAEDVRSLLSGCFGLTLRETDHVMREYSVELASELIASFGAGSS